MGEKQVKGTMLLDFIRIIRANKEKDWDRYLTPEDWEIVKTLILPTKWYPYETYVRCAKGAFEIIAGGKLEGARYNGQLVAKKLFEGTYKSVISVKDPLRGLKQFVQLYSSFFNFAAIKFEKIDEKHAKIHHDKNPDDADNIVSYCHQLMGMLETIVQMTGGRNHKIEIIAKEWEGAPATTFDITWQ